MAASETTIEVAPDGTLVPSLQQAANKIVRRHMVFAGIGGVLPVPLLEVAAISSLQLRMVSQLCDIYGLQFSRNAVKAAIGTLLATALPTNAVSVTTMTVVRAVPGIGQILGLATVPLLAGASTWALGRVFTWHFARGGTIDTFDSAHVRERFRAEFEEGKRMASEVISGGKSKATARPTAAKAP